MKLDDIVMIGAGNLGFHLCLALHNAGFTISQVYSHTMAHAADLAEKVNAEPITALSKVKSKSSLYIIAVKDDNISSVARQIGHIQGMVVHTSGASLSTLLAPLGEEYGVFWPLQTMKRSRPADFSSVPIVITGSTDQTEKTLRKLAKKIGGKTYILEEEERRTVHLAAVFLNNFTNHMAVATYDILDQKNIPHDILFPLLQETVGAIGLDHPAKNQTGPAIRGDSITMARHIDMLRTNPHYALVYEAISKSIHHRYKMDQINH